jgi:hypothetical protein
VPCDVFWDVFPIVVPSLDVVWGVCEGGVALGALELVGVPGVVVEADVLDLVVVPVVGV